MREPDEDRPGEDDPLVRNQVHGDIYGRVVQGRDFDLRQYHYWAHSKPENIPSYPGRPALCYCRELSNVTHARTGGSTGGAVVAISGWAAADAAWHWAWEKKDEFPGGQIFINLPDELGPSASAADIASAVLRDLGVAREALPPDAATLLEKCKYILQRKRMLIVLLHAEGAWQIDPFLSANAVATLVVASALPLIGVRATASFDTDTFESYEFPILPTQAERREEFFEEVLGLGGLAAIITVIVMLNLEASAIRVVLTIVGITLGVTLIAMIGKAVVRFFSPFVPMVLTVDRRGLYWPESRADTPIEWRHLASAGATDFALADLHPALAEAAAAFPNVEARVLYLQYPQRPVDRSPDDSLLSHAWFNLGYVGHFFVSLGADPTFNVVDDSAGTLTQVLSAMRPCYFPLSESHN